jgi:tetratricopeptide (TPR) repeat protein
MVKRPLKLDTALDTLPALDDLVPLREALLAASVEDVEQRWADGRRYRALGGRLADLAEVRRQASALAEEVRRRTEAVMSYALDALEALERGDHAAAATALVRAGEVEESAGRLDPAERLFAAALEHGRRPRDRRAEGLALRRLGRVARARGDAAEASRLYRRGLEVAEAQRDVDGAVVACQGLGNVAVDQGLWTDARDWYLRGLSTLGEDGAPSVLRWQLLANLAVVERRAGELAAAEAWLVRARREADAVDDPVGRHYAAHGWARLSLTRGDCAAAEREARRALEMPSDAGSRIAARLTLAEALLGDGRPTEAEAEARRAELDALSNRLTGRLPDVYRALGKAAQSRGDAEGFLFFEEALSICEAHALPALERAMVQHDYGRFERWAGNLEAAAARLRAALDGFVQLGSGAEADAVRAELAALDAGPPKND